MEEFFHFRVHGCASYDDFLETSAQCVNQFLADLPVYLSVEQGNAERPFHGLFVDDGLYDILVYLFNDKGDGDNQVGFHFLESFHQNLWGRHFSQQCDVCADGRGGKEIECAAVCMCQRQEREHFVPFLQQLGTYAEGDVAGQVVSRQHDALTESGGARGIIQQHDLVVGKVRVNDVFLTESVRVGRFHFIAQMLEETLDGFAVPLIQTAEVAQREHTANSGKPFFFQMFPNGIAGEEERRFGVVYDMMDIIGVEVLQNGDYDTAVGDGGHIGDAPAGIVLADDGYLVAAAQLAVLENKVQSGYFLCHFAISIALVFSIVGIAGEVPILAETMLV